MKKIAAAIFVLIALLLVLGLQGPSVIGVRVVRQTNGEAYSLAVGQTNAASLGLSGQAAVGSITNLFQLMDSNGTLALSLDSNSTFRVGTSLVADQAGTVTVVGTLTANVLRAVSADITGTTTTTNLAVQKQVVMPEKTIDDGVIDWAKSPRQTCLLSVNTNLIFNNFSASYPFVQVLFKQTNGGTYTVTLPGGIKNLNRPTQDGTFNVDTNNGAITIVTFFFDAGQTNMLVSGADSTNLVDIAGLTVGSGQLLIGTGTSIIATNGTAFARTNADPVHAAANFVVHSNVLYRIFEPAPANNVTNFVLDFAYNEQRITGIPTTNAVYLLHATNKPPNSYAAYSQLEIRTSTSNMLFNVPSSWHVLGTNASTTAFLLASNTTYLFSFKCSTNSESFVFMNHPVVTE